MIDPGAERWRRLTVKEGWRQFVTDEPTERPESAAEAIDGGPERITRKLLDGIDIGYAAEVGAGRQQPQRAAA